MKSQIANRQSKIAFILVELLVVVTIIVVLLVLFVPAMDLLRSPGVYAWESVSPNPFPSPFQGACVHGFSPGIVP